MVDDQLTATLAHELNAVRKKQQRRQQRMKALQADVEVTLQRDEERIAARRRTLTLLKAHDLKDDLATHGIGSVHLKQQSDDRYSIEEVRDAHDNPIDSAEADRVLSASGLNFHQIALADPGYAAGDGAVIFDATGNPGELRRAELEDRLEEIHHDL